jgi:glycine/betaine/sarcosine/D-proline reductase family selenoprotein B
MSDAPVAYMERTRRYYAALGHAPYVWASFADVPFARLKRSLADCRVSLVTTAAPYDSAKGEQGPGAPYNASAKFYRVYSGSSADDPDVRISHVAIDRAHTTAEDKNSYFPLAALKRAEEKGLIGQIASRFHGLPTNRSQRTSINVDCPELVERVLHDGADAVILVPNCPVCHQSCALAARALEAAGLATVVMGTALDIVAHVGVPRFLFSDFPLGNSAGRPNDQASQDQTLGMALRLLSDATAARTVWQSPVRWSDDPAWKLDYCNIDRLSASEIARRRTEYAAIREEARKVREG